MEEEAKLSKYATGGPSTSLSAINVRYLNKNLLTSRVSGVTSELQKLLEDLKDFEDIKTRDGLSAKLSNVLKNYAILFKNIESIELEEQDHTGWYGYEQVKP